MWIELNTKEKIESALVVIKSLLMVPIRFITPTLYRSAVALILIIGFNMKLVPIVLDGRGLNGI